LISTAESSDLAVLMKSRVALFERGSKISHSCRPNLKYNSKRTAGLQDHYAIRAIKASDELTIQL